MPGSFSPITVVTYSDSAFNNVGFFLTLATNTETILPFDGIGSNDAGQIAGNRLYCHARAYCRA